MPDIHTYLEGLQFPRILYLLKPEQANLNISCNVTFMGGKTFRLNGCTGELSFNELIKSVYKIAINHAGHVEGKELYQRLNIVHLIGQKALATKPWYIRLVTYVRDFFTSLQGASCLNKIKIMKGQNSLDSYCNKHTPELAKILKDHGVDTPASDFYFIPHSFFNGTTTRITTVGPGIAIPHTSKAYSGLTHYRAPLVNIDEGKSLRDHFDLIIQGINRTLPTWLKGRQAISSIVADLRIMIGALLNESTTAKSLNCVLGDVVADAQFTEQEALDYSFVLKFVHESTREPICELRLKPKAIEVSDNDFREKLKRSLHSLIDDKFDGFIENYMKKAPSAKPPKKSSDSPFGSFNFAGFDGLFEGMFSSGQGFTTFFEAKPASDTGEAPVSRQLIEANLKKIERLIKAEGKLIKLLEAKNFSDLKTALKKAAIKLHPDKVAEKGGTPEQIKEATDVFQNILGPVLAYISKQMQ